jgi:hypothetical protein
VRLLSRIWRGNSEVLGKGSAVAKVAVAEHSVLSERTAGLWCVVDCHP